MAEDWIRYRNAQTQTQAVPTALMRQGNFSELLGPNPWYKAGTIDLRSVDLPVRRCFHVHSFPGQHHPGKPIEP